MNFILDNRSGVRVILCIDCGEWAPISSPVTERPIDLLMRLWEQHARQCPYPPRPEAADGIRNIQAQLEYEQSRYYSSPPYYSTGANADSDMIGPVPPRTLRTKNGKVIPHPELSPDIPLTPADDFRALCEAESILKINEPLLRHQKLGCNCTVCEEKFLVRYEKFVTEYDEQQKGAPEMYNPETAEWKNKFPKKGGK